MRILYKVTRIMEKHTVKLIVLIVLSHFRSVHLSATGNCPSGQVFHFNLTVHKGFCCIPVPLPKGYGYKSCTRNGTPDTIEVCPKKPEQLYQWDNTSTSSEATCTAEMQCLNEEIMKIEKCEKPGQNCHNECVCNFPGGYCGTEYFNCNPFPTDCPKEDVQKDCSCRRSIPSTGSGSGSGSKNRSIKSDLDVPNPMNPDTSVRNIPSSSSSGKSDKKSVSNHTPDAGVSKEKEDNSSLNNNVTETGQEESLSSGVDIPVAVIVLSAVGGVVTVLAIMVCVFHKHLCKMWQWVYRQWKNRSSNEDPERGRTIMEVRPFCRNSQQEQYEEAQTLQRHVSGQSEPAEHEVEAQPLSGEPQFILSDDWPTLGSSLFHSHDNTTDQQEVCDESRRHQTDVKGVVNSENLHEEEEQSSGAVDNSRLHHVEAEPTLSSNGLWSDFDRSILHSSESAGIPLTESISQRGGGEEEL